MTKVPHHLYKAIPASLAVFFLITLLAMDGTAALPSSLGWYAIPNTRLRSVCPPNNFGGSSYQFASLCNGVTEAWNSGVMDTTRNRLIIWGGGHNDYSGNELYALNLNSLTLTRLTDPGLPVADPLVCPASLVNGTQPNARHTYDGIAYIANVDRMFVYGGAISCGGGMSSDLTWTYNFATSQWENRNPTGTKPRQDLGLVSAYDPNTGKVFVHDTLDLYAYTFSSNSWQKLTSNNTGIDYHLAGTIDPVRKKFVMVGGGQAWVYDISGSTFVRQALTAGGGSAIVNSGYPGLAYDPNTDRIVAWNGGNTVYSLNLDANTWTAISNFSGGPGAARAAGTYDRWSYSPASGVFVVVNSVDQDAFAFRLTSGGTPPPPDTTVPTVSLSAPAADTTVSGEVTVSANASDNVGIAGVQFKMDGANLGPEDTSSSYSISWNTTGTTNGSHTLTAVARDAAGNQATSSSITVTVSNDTTAPSGPTGLRLR